MKRQPNRQFYFYGRFFNLILQGCVTILQRVLPHFWSLKKIQEKAYDFPQIRQLHLEIQTDLHLIDTISKMTTKLRKFGLTIKQTCLSTDRPKSAAIISPFLVIKKTRKSLQLPANSSIASGSLAWPSSNRHDFEDDYNFKDDYHLERISKMTTKLQKFGLIIKLTCLSKGTSKSAAVISPFLVARKILTSCNFIDRIWKFGLTFI